MRRRLIALAVVGAIAVAVGVATALAQGGPSGERILGGPGFASGVPVIDTSGLVPEPVAGTVIEPAVNDGNGSLTYISTPARTPNPVKSNPKAAAPLYLVVYPTDATGLGTDTLPLNCWHSPSDNCPDHGDAVAGAAYYYDLTRQADPIHTTVTLSGNVYTGGGSPGAGVLGHDHLIAVPGGHGDFNVAWVPVLVLFTSTPSERVLTEERLNTLYSEGKVVEIPLDGTEPPLPNPGPGPATVQPNLTFHCSVVSQAVWNKAVPWPGTVGP